MSKILITGGCGMLGSSLAQKAIILGHDVCIVDNLCKSGSLNNLNWLKTLGNIEFYSADIKNYDDIYVIIKNFLPDTIFHVAGQVAMTSSIINPMRDFSTNVIGSINILEAVRLISPNTTILYASTNKVYGDLAELRYIEDVTRYTLEEYQLGFLENMPFAPTTPYGCSKGVADLYFQDYARIFGLNTVVLRHSTIYGARQFATLDQGWIGWFCTKALEIKNKTLNSAVTISGTGKQVRDILYISDAVELYFNCVNNIKKVAGMTFNVGGGAHNSLSLIELFLLLEDLLNVKIPYTKLEERISDQKFFIANTQSLYKLLNWKPLVSKEEGLKLMINWLENL